jgi:hypothetical protein
VAEFWHLRELYILGITLGAMFALAGIFYPHSVISTFPGKTLELDYKMPKWSALPQWNSLRIPRSKLKGKSRRLRTEGRQQKAEGGFL